jgi:Ni,Fe-hydrogenase maturation factor
LSTPNAQEGYFYEAYTNPSFGFRTFHVNSEEVAEGRPEPQRSIMLGYLEREKARMSPMQYSQQYLAQFQEELGQLFPDALIQGAQTLERLDFIDNLTARENYYKNSNFFLGVDVARMGGDETTFEIFERKDGVYYQRDNIVNKYTLTTQTISKILELDKLYNFKNIYIDDGGLGVAVFDQLLTHVQTKNKVIPINNATRSLEVNANRTRKLLKEDLYLNFLAMLEKGEILLLKDPEIFTSLKSIMIEHDVTKANIKIYGRYSHITEGIIRAAWSNHSTRLNLWVR